jgi:hypothetical protein
MDSVLTNIIELEQCWAKKYRFERECVKKYQTNNWEVARKYSVSQGKQLKVELIKTCEFCTKIVVRTDSKRERIVSLV